MAETGGFGSVILPSTQPALGDVMMRGMDRQQRQFDRNANLLIHQREAAQAQAHRNQLYNLNQIGDAADEKQYMTGEQAIDAYSHKKLQEIQDWAMQNAIDKDPAVAAQMIRQKMQTFIPWHTAIKNDLKKINVGLTEFNKTYPNADAQKAHNMAVDNMANEYMIQGADGKWEPKPVEFIKPRDFVSELQDPKNLGGLINDTSPFTQKLHGLEKSVISDADVSNIKGYGKKVKWSATTTPYSDIKPGPDGLPVIDVKHQTLAGVKDENGQPMKFVDDSIVKDLQGDPKAWASALSMWNQEKPAIEAKLGRKIDDSESDFRFKNMLYNKLNQFLPRGVKTEQQQIVPKPPKITVNVGGAGTNVPIHDAYGEIVEKAGTKEHGIPLNELSPASQQAAIEIARKITGNTMLGNPDIFIGKGDDGKLHIADALTGKSISSINQTDINLAANKSLGVKTKQKIVSQGNTTTKSKVSAKFNPDDLRNKYKY